jgi:hypothetical protein
MSWPSDLLDAILDALRGRKPKPPDQVPPTPSTYTVRVECFEGDPSRDEKVPGAVVTLGDRSAIADGAGNAHIFQVPRGTYRLDVTADGFIDEVDRIDVPTSPVRVSLERDVPPLVALTTDRQIFRAAGQPWRWKGVTAFRLLDRFDKGEDIGPFLEAYRGYNVLRVFGYVPVKDWGESAWDWPEPDAVVRFVQHCAARGFYVELTLLTDDDKVRVDQARWLIAKLAPQSLPSMLVEIANEPQTHKDVNTAELRGVCSASGFLYSSGDYEDSTRHFGHYLTAHTGRDSDWPRRAHDLMEYYGGGGPNAPSDPAHRVPVVADEPIRPDQAQGDRARDFLAYYGTCSLLGAGATIHTESGKLANLPTASERECIAAALAGLNAFPADAPLGPYSRPVENSLRTYVVGNCMVRVRPTTPNAPEPGWTPIDSGGVLWRR